MSQVAINQDVLGFSIVHVDVDQFDTAKRLAAISAELDDTKHQFNPDIRYAAMNCIQAMQEMAELLAGKRFGEIYDLTDGVVA